jgi:hypothetical protein
MLRSLCVGISHRFGAPQVDLLVVARPCRTAQGCRSESPSLLYRDLAHPTVLFRSSTSLSLFLSFLLKFFGRQTTTAHSNVIRCEESTNEANYI